jgi:hypothetical protein
LVASPETNHLSHQSYSCLQSMEKPLQLAIYMAELNIVYDVDLW